MAEDLGVADLGAPDWAAAVRNLVQDHVPADHDLASACGALPLPEVIDKLRELTCGVVGPLDVHGSAFELLLDSAYDVVVVNDPACLDIGEPSVNVSEFVELVE